MNTKNGFATGALLAFTSVLQGCATPGTTGSDGSRRDVATGQRESPVALAPMPPAGQSPSDLCDRGLLPPAIAFESGSAALVPCAVRVLEESIKTLRQSPGLRVEVAGHTDSTEAKASSKALSLQRAQVVYDHLIAEGVPASVLSGPVGYGAERLLQVDVGPDGSAVDAEAPRLNRRVELNVQTGEPVP